MPPWSSLLLVILFGSQEAAVVARARHGIDQLCPCAAADAACEAHHDIGAAAVGHVVAEAADPGDVLATLIGLGCHETRFAMVQQLNGGRAVSYFQLEATAHAREARAADAAAWLDDPVLAARVALARARTCGGSLRGYAWGSCSPGSAEQERVAAELRRYVLAARWATR